MKKIILSLILVVSLLSFHTQKTFAFGDLVFDPTAQTTRLVQLGKDIITSVSSFTTAGMLTSLNVKEFTLDPLVRMLANAALQAAKQTAMNWIKSGFSGNPSFIVNPDIYFKNIASDAIRQNIANVQNAGGIFANSIVGSIVQSTRNERSDLSSKLSYTLGSTIQNNACNEDNITKLAMEQVGSGLTVANPLTGTPIPVECYSGYSAAAGTAAGQKKCNDWKAANDTVNGVSKTDIEAAKNNLRQQLCTGDAANDPLLQKRLTYYSNNNFSVGGWDALIGSTLPNNNEYGQKLIASLETAKKAAAAQENEKTLLQGSVLPMKKCADQGGNIGTPDINTVDTANTPSLLKSNTNTSSSKAAYDNSWSGVIAGQNTNNSAVNNPNTAPCSNSEVTTPPEFVSDTAIQALKSGWDNISNVHEIGEFFSALLSSTLNELLYQGVNSVTNGINDGLNSLVSDNDLSTPGSNPYKPYTGSPLDLSSSTLNAGLSNDTGYATTNGSSKDKLLGEINKHLSSIDQLKSTDSAYMTALSTYDGKLNQLAACYADLRSGTYTNSLGTSVNYNYTNDPSVVAGKAFIANMRPTIASKRSEIQDEIATANTSVSGIGAIRDQIQATTDVQTILNLYQNYSDKKTSGVFVGEGQYFERQTEFEQTKMNYLEKDIITDYSGTGQLLQYINECETFRSKQSNPNLFF